MREESARHYAVALRWEGDRGAGTSSYEVYDRRFRVRVDGKPDLLGSADPAFRGDPTLYNPEELLLAAVASCHMLFYLSLCARAGIAVVSYADAPEGTVGLFPGGGGQFQEIVLHPRVRLSRGGDHDAAAALHRRAGELCFIANSCRFPIRNEAAIEPNDDQPAARGPAERRRE
jgi:organic hydroperoxide reductase OsmC/OhrA